MWGGSATVAARLRPKLTSDEADAWAPALMPVVGSKAAAREEEAWEALPMPLMQPAKAVPSLVPDAFRR